MATEKQIVAVKTKCGCLFRKFSDQACTLDDESYFMFIHSTFIDINGHYTSDFSMTQPVIKFAIKVKFEIKIFFLRGV